jgi:hypothetical protein
MNVYYFYKPSEYRPEQRSKGVIDFDLKAFFCNDSSILKKQRFHYGDEVSVLAATKEPGLYDFEFLSDLLGTQVQSDINVIHLKELMLKRKYHWVSEKNYFRYRKLAIKLMVQKTSFLHFPFEGEHKYIWGHDTNTYFYDLRLYALTYRVNAANHDERTLKFFREQNIKTNDLTVPEEVSLFFNKSLPKGGWSDYTYRLHIRGIGMNPRYHNFEEALSSFKHCRHNDYQTISAAQYDRLRNFCRQLFLKHSDLQNAMATAWSKKGVSL